MIIQPSDIDNEISAIADKIYPVGSIYMSINSTSPASLFGGTWEQITNRFLLSAGSSYTAGATGGEATHTLTVAEMPKHNHLTSSNASSNQTINTSSNGSHDHEYWGDITVGNVKTAFYSNGGNMGWGYSNYVGYKTGSAGSHSHTFTEYTRGSGTAHNNMPPYLVVYMWKRTA